MSAADATMLADFRAVAATRAGTRFFAVELDGVIAAYCELYLHAGAAQVEDVNTLEPWRNRGAGRAVVLGAAAAARAAGADLVWLVADADDWPSGSTRSSGSSRSRRPGSSRGARAASGLGAERALDTEHMSRIEYVHAREILDSRGNPTVEVDVVARRRRVRPRGGALRRLHRRARGARAARRRPARYGGKGVLGGRRQRERPDRRRGRGPRRASTSAASTGRCSTSTAPPTKRALGANAILGGVARRRAGGGRPQRPARCTATSADRTRTCCRRRC